MSQVWDVIAWCWLFIAAAFVAVIIAGAVIDAQAWDVEPEWRPMVKKQRAREREAMRG